MRSYELKYKLEHKNWVEETKMFNTNLSSDVYHEAKTGLYFVVNYVGRIILNVRYGMKREPAKAYSAGWVVQTARETGRVK